MNGREAQAIVARYGWHVFPGRYRDKRPRPKDWERCACADPGQVGTFWPDGANLLIAAGKSGLTVLDSDPPDGREQLERIRAGRDMPATYTVSTARRGGVQFYYRTPPGVEIRNSTSRIAPRVDVRGSGGYVVGAGSRVDQRAYSEPVDLANGGRYVVLDDRDPVWLPAWLAKAALPPERPAPDHPPLPVRAATTYGEAALRGECDLLSAMPPRSGRNDQLNRSAYKLGRLVPEGILDAAAISAGLMQAARACLLVAEDGEARCRATITSGLTAGMASPRQVVMAR